VGRFPLIRAFLARRSVKVLAVLAGLCLAAFAAMIMWLPLPDRLHTSDSVVVTWRDDTPAHIFLSNDEKWRVPVGTQGVAPAYIDALLQFEDQRFWEHPGVDVLAIFRAALSNLGAGRRVSGASTITMQVVRLLEPRPRTFTSKTVEAFRAMQLEYHLSKTEILDQYLRLAPFGRNIEGIEAACWAYFQHSASALTADEIAVLLAVPQSPAARYPQPKNENNLKTARDRIARRLLDEGLLPRGKGDGAVGPQEVLAQILGSDVPTQLQPFPRDIPHVAFWARSKFPNQTRIKTTLDESTQKMVEDLVLRRREEAQRVGVNNTAVVVIESKSVEVRALIGGFAYDDSPGAQIPGFDVPRSPGSLLKPFIVASAMDAGVALPRYLVPDVPFQSGNYIPQNYDGKFSGLVRLDDALVRSLNIPFVELLREVGVENFVGTLMAMGAQHVVTTPGWYGLTAAVGGVELTPLEVAAMYATLARGGLSRPAQVFSTPGADLKVYSPGASWTVTQVLQARERPDFAARRLVNPFGRRVFWKTGTSFGNLDAWAVGAGESMTVAVWMGNQDRKSSSALVGSKRCGPLLFDILEAVETQGEAITRPNDLVEVEVCSYSGHLPTQACEHRAKTWALRSKVPSSPCPYHVRADIDEDTGLVLTPECRADKTYSTQNFVQWPASVRRYLDDRNRSGREKPSYAPGCRPRLSSEPPIILYPPPDRTLVLVPGLEDHEQQQPLEADSSDSTMMLNWYVDGVHVGSASAGNRLWWTPSVGSHDIVVMDELGRTVRRKIQVR
jgi:penicillin-binding protein 1C